VQHIIGRHGRQRAQLFDVDFGPPVRQDVDDGLLPVGAVAQQAQVAERLLGAAELALALGELVAESDEELAEALALILRQGQDAGDVVALGGLLLLGEVADEVAAVVVAGGHAVEEERVDVVVEGLVVEEELRQQAQVAAPGALPPAVDLEEADVVVAVDLVAGRVQERAFGAVALEGPPSAEVRQAELADVHHFFFRVFDRVRAEVPRLHLVLAHLHPAQVPHPADFRLVLRHAAARAEFLDLLLARVRGVVGGGGLGGGGGVLDVDEVHLFVFGFGRAFEHFGLHDRDMAAFVIFAPVLFAAGFGGSGDCFALGVRRCAELGRRGHFAGPSRAWTRAFLTRFGK